MTNDTLEQARSNLVILRTNSRLKVNELLHMNRGQVAGARLRRFDMVSRLQNRGPPLRCPE